MKPLGQAPAHETAHLRSGRNVSIPIWHEALEQWAERFEKALTDFGPEVTRWDQKVLLLRAGVKESKRVVRANKASGQGTMPANEIAPLWLAIIGEPIGENQPQ
jgi:hypothetical protein